MTNSKFKLLLDNLRALILKSRPAYRDYIGTEDVIEKTVLISGKLSADGESVNAKDAFKGFVEGETYKVTIGDETVDATAQYGTGSFSGCIVIGSSNVMPSDEIPGWMICVYNGNLLGYGTGEWTGKPVEVFTEKTVKVDRWDVKKLPEECLPEKMPEKWAEELDTGGGVLYVPMEINYANSQGTGTVNGVTFEEAQQAVKDGKMLVAVIPIYDAGIELLAPMAMANSDVIAFEFINPKTTLKLILIQWTADGQVHYQISNSLDYTVIPVTVTETDGGYTATSRYTYKQVRALVDEGKNVVVRIDDGKIDFYLALTYDAGSVLGFSAAGVEGLYGMLRWNENKIIYIDDMLLTDQSLSDTAPLPAGTASAGTNPRIARADHVHPSELYFVPMTVDSAGDGNYTTTTTAVFDDAKAAAESGKSVWAKISYLGDSVCIPLTVYASNTIIFSGAYSTTAFFTVFWVNGNQPRFVRSDVLTDGALADSAPLAAGEASSGTGVKVARADHVHPKELPDGLELGNNYIILSSSTANSTKKFKITVDDTGTLTATEVTTTT